MSIPKWFLIAAGVLASIVGATWKVSTAVAESQATVSRKLAENTNQFYLFNVRLCRIERALRIDPWPDCPK